MTKEEERDKGGKQHSRIRKITRERKEQRKTKVE